MLWEEIKTIKSTDKDLKKFGITVGLVVGLIGIVLLFRGKAGYIYFVISALLLVIPAFIFPKILLPIQKIWMTLAVVLGWVMTRVILSILFYLIVTPIGIISRVFGKQFLDIKSDRSQPSYWHPRERSKIEPKKYENQF